MSNLHRGHSIDASYQVLVVAMFANRSGRNEVVVQFVDIVEIIAHHGLSFLLIIVY
jgi:hypothetical protein